MSTDPTSHEPTAPAPGSSPRAVLKVSRTALLGVVVALVGTGPLVAADTARLGWIALLPLLAAAWVLRVRTVADARGLEVRSAFRTRSVAWDDVDGVRFPRSGWGRAVLRGGTEVALPAVGFNDLRVLSVASGGRVPDPFAAAAAARAAREEAENADTGADAEPPPSAPGLTW